MQIAFRRLPDVRFFDEPRLREKLLSITEGATLEPVLETEIKRMTRALKTAAGGEFELALDRGEIRTLINGHAIVPISEIELELKTGTPLALYDVARRLTRKDPADAFTREQIRTRHARARRPRHRRA